MQVPFDDGAALQSLGGVHRVDDLLLTLTHLITQAVTGCAGHAGDRQGHGERDREAGRAAC